VTEPPSTPPTPRRAPVPFIGLTILALLLFACIVAILLIRQPWSAAAVIPTITINPTTVLSPQDTRQIAFMSNRDGNWEIYQYTLGTGEWLNLTNTPADDAFPSYSLDGAAMSFVSNRDRAELGELTAYNMDADGANQRRVVADLATIMNILSTGRFDWDQLLTPAGSTLVSLRDFNLEVYAAPPDGDAINISQNGATDWFASFSPAGNGIAFASDRDGDQNIYVSTPDGETIRQLTADNTTNLSPVWSSDGRILLFYSERDATLDGGSLVLYTLDPNAESPAPVRVDGGVTGANGSPGIFDQQYDAGMLGSIYMAYDGNDWEIYYQSADGSSPVNLTNNESDELFPVWR
jgi:TolB protein